jgi:HSP20 family protein
MRNSLVNYWLNDFDKDFFPGLRARPFERFENHYFSIRADVLEDEKNLVFHFDLPGVKKEDVKIQLEGDRLTISGQRAGFEKTDSQTMHREERVFGQFERSFVLPEHLDVEKTEAAFKDGVLTVMIAKKPETQPKVIPIKVQ